METDGETGRWEIKKDRLTDEQDTERGQQSERATIGGERPKETVGRKERAFSEMNRPTGNEAGTEAQAQRAGVG